MPDQAIASLRDYLHRLATGTDAYDQIGEEIRSAKAEVVAKYGELFSPEHIPALTEEEFKGFLLFRNNHHWDSLHRQGPRMTADMASLRKALAILVDEQRPVQERLDQIRPGNKEPMVKGLGRAVLTAILLVRYPEKYGVLNGVAEDAMKTLGVWPSLPNGASFGKRYEIVNTVLTSLANEIPTDLWTLDALWWRALPHVPIGSDATALPARSVTIDDLVPAKTVSTGNSLPTSDNAAFALEAHLQEFLVENWAQTNLGAEWDLIEKDGEIVGSYYQTHEVGVIDLLAKHKKGGRWLVVELKRGQTSDATVGQLLRYRSWVREKIAAAGEVVEGIIVCSDADLKLRYAVKGLDHVRCLTYQVSFTLTPAELSVAKAPVPL